MRFDSKIVKFILIAVVLFLIYRYVSNKKHRTESVKEFNNSKIYFKYDNISDNSVSLKPILKKNKKIHNKRVRFSLPQNFEIDENEKQLIEKNIEEHIQEKNYEKDNTTELCQKKEVDLGESFKQKLDKIKDCDKIIKNNISLRDIYDDIVVDYKKNQDFKDLQPVINTRKDAGFGLTSYENTHWNYQGENLINGGVDNYGMYANDPNLDSVAKF